MMSETPGRFPEVSAEDAAILLSEILEIPRLDLRLRGNRALLPAETAAVHGAFQRRAAGEPIQYITGKAYFRNLVLEVGPGVLIPRPETETMVEIAIRLAPPNPKICDLGTGSGAVAIALATEIDGAEVAAVDISPESLEYAERNKHRNHAENLRLLQGDLFEPLAGEKFDVLTANLPYISDDFMERLPREVRGFEPETALAGGADGLDYVRRAAENAPRSLRNGGSAVFEISPEQAEATLEILRSAGFAEASVEKDLTGRERFAVGAR